MDQQHELCGSRRWVFVALLLVWITCWQGTGHAEERFVLPAAVSPRATVSRLVRRAPPDEALPMSVTLTLRHRDELTALLAAQQDPHASEFHRWLTPAEFADRFGASIDRYAALTDWLEREGFTVRTWPNRTRIDFTGTVARAERTFDVRMHHYRHNDRIAVANGDPPWLPTRFAETVESLRLNTFPLARPLFRVTGFGGPQNAMAPGDIYRAYDIQPVLDRGINGAGQTIAVVARADFTGGDVIRFQQVSALAIRNPVKIFPGANPGIGAANGVCAGLPRRAFQDCVSGEQQEVLLDTEWAGALAPAAAVLVDIGDTDIDVSFQDIVNHHPEAKIITMSFGACERQDSADRTIFAPLYSQAATQGQTVVVATGDDGVDDCLDGKSRGVSVFATDINVTAVGGTALDPGFDDAGNATGYVSESVWNDNQGASGGGVSTLVPKPAYQKIPGVPTDGFRDVPDVALLASPLSPGYMFVFADAIGIIGGTSVGAPCWAGIVALLNQATASNGLGALNPMLYSLGQKQYSEHGPAVFHDVVAGDNGLNGLPGYLATTGFDQATGLGTPDVDLLVRAFAPPACTGDCNSNGTVTADELLAGVERALGGVSFLQCPGFGVDVTVDQLIAATNLAVNNCP